MSLKCHGMCYELLACKAAGSSIFRSVCMCEHVYWDYPGVFSPCLSPGDLLAPVE